MAEARAHEAEDARRRTSRRRRPTEKTARADGGEDRDRRPPEREVELEHAVLVRRRHGRGAAGARRGQQGLRGCWPSIPRPRRRACSSTSTTTPGCTGSPTARSASSPTRSTVWFLVRAHRLAASLHRAVRGRRAARADERQVRSRRSARRRRRKSFYLTTSKESLFERHLYRMPVAGGAMTKLTTTAGWHDARRLAGRHDDRRRLLVHEQAAGAVRRRRRASRPRPRRSSRAIRGSTCRSCTSPRATARRCPARIYKPANWNGGPAVIFVHGAGYLQNVHRGWSSYFREYMFHHLLMERGYLVLDIDYRASSGYGRDWRTAIYRHMGGVDLERSRRRRAMARARASRRSETHRHLRRQLRRLHHADGDVHHARRLRRRRRAAPGHRLGALQPPLHREHPQHAAEATPRRIASRRRSTLRKG